MLKGSHMTEESKRKISISITGKNNPNYGKHHSRKTRKLLSNRAKNQFMFGMPETTKEKMRQSHHKRVIATIGHTLVSNGYIWIKVGNRKYEGQHRYIAEQVLGRKLAKNELIHHIDGNGLNNNLNNLYLFDKKEVHFSFEILFKYGYLNRDILKSNLSTIKEIK